jgi:5-methylcytosine-specific restriction enzyme subunit McrC
MQIQLAKSDKIGIVGTIPLRNIWLLMLYASEFYRYEGTRCVGAENNPEKLPELIAELLASAVESRLHRNLTFGYKFQEAQLSRVRGRIDILATERRQLLAKGKVACRFENLSVDTLRNRFVLSALQLLIGLLKSPAIIRKCRSLVSSLKQLGVSDNRPTRSEISTDKLGRNDYSDRLMLSAAKLAYDMAVPTETDGSNLLFIPNRDEVWIRKLYERAVGGVYSVKLSKTNWKVEISKPLRWKIEARTTAIDAILPSMRTDIVLVNHLEGRKLIIDTKFNSLLTQGWYRDETIRSSYLYQMYAYLMSQNDNNNPLDKGAAGLLLHPTVNANIDEIVVIQGHPIRFSTVDLTAPSADFSNRLIQLIDFPKL